TLAPQYQLSGNELKIIFDTRPATTGTDVSDRTEAPPPALTYDDLDAYVPKKKSSPETPKINSTTTDIGPYNETIHLFANNFNNGAFSIMGNVIGNFSMLNTSSFPDLKIIIQLNTNEQIYTGACTISFAHPEQFL